jgi:hypothetical protein
MAGLSAAGVSLAISTAASAALLNFNAGTFTGGANNDGDVLTGGYRLADRNLSGATADAMVEVISGDGRVRSREFGSTASSVGGVLTISSVDGSPFDLASFVLSNFTFNAAHRHGMVVTYFFVGGASTSSPLLISGIDFPSDRNVDGTLFTVNLTNLTSVEFANTRNPAETNGTPRAVFIDDVSVTPSVIPEPTMLGVVATFGLTLVRSRRN